MDASIDLEASERRVGRFDSNTVLWLFWRERPVSCAVQTQNEALPGLCDHTHACARVHQCVRSLRRSACVRYARAMLAGARA